MTRLSLIVVAALSASLVANACGSKPPAPPPAPRSNADSIARARQDSIRRAQEAEEARRRAEAERMSAAERARVTAEVRTMLATMIHFDYDKSNVRAGDGVALDSKVAILRANPNVRLRISGHCDERGSDEYNLALGNRRATSTKQYLVSHGIDASRLETLSFGEERPAAMGHDDAAWAQNRRAEFELIAGGDALVRP